MIEQKYRLGFLGAWGLFVVGAILAAAVATAEWQNLRDAQRLRKLDVIDRMIEARLGPRLDLLRGAAEESEGRVEQLHSAMRDTELKLDESQDTGQLIVVSTAENRLYVRREGRTIFQAICSTGKGTTLTDASGRSMVFNTPTGKFRIVRKEENPLWVPPDWHFIEEARKKGKRLVRLEPGVAIDAATGAPAGSEESVHNWGPRRRSRVLSVRRNTVVETRPDGTERELPPGEIIEAGGAIVMPPHGTPQRRFDKVLGKYRLNMGSGYGIHGTMYPDQLGRSVTHGCVRLGDADIQKLFAMANVGDQVLIY
ncbi:MAG TPA: L,D-transpeptidase [Thermoanaerobaculia bacterium]|nr:L,D-transpeptidase [Thermoanaerobaculia bacterium]